MEGREEAIGRVAVIMPTYNERANVESTAGRVRHAVPDADLLVVDDNSPDGTGDLADKLAAEDPHVNVLHRECKAPPTSRGSGGRWSRATAWSWRWTPMARTCPRNCPGCWAR
jgi:dolichol-phosphate mannosyltransferase